MEHSTQALYNAALRLSESERAELAARLIESLDPEADDDIESAWSAEIQKRLAELDSGEVTPVDWTDVKGQLVLRHTLILGWPGSSLRQSSRFPGPPIQIPSCDEAL